jgi:hypothetical protein
MRFNGAFPMQKFYTGLNREREIDIGHGALGIG